MNRWRPLLLLVVSAAAVIPVLFQATRVIRNYRLPDYADIARFDPAREGGHLLPDLDLLMRGERLDRAARIVTNSKGFRNAREFDHDRPEGEYRVLLLGDSFIDGMRTDQGDTIGFALQEFLNAEAAGGRHERFEVIISGHNNPANALYFFQEHGWKVSPDLVVLGVTLGNDITWHSYRDGVLPRRDESGALRLELSPEVRQAGQYQVDLLLPGDAYSQEGGFDETLQDLGLAVRRQLARMSLAGYAVPPLLGPGPSERRHVYAAGFFASLGLFHTPPMPELEPMLRDFEEVLLGFHELVGRSGARFLAVLLPVRIQVSSVDWELMTRYFSLAEERFDLTLPNRRITAFCELHGVSCLDLQPDFAREFEQHGVPLYRSRGDMHFSEVGQALAGRSIGQRIVPWTREGGEAVGED